MAAEASLTYVTTTQPLGPLYTPEFQIPEKFRAQFAPTMITDASGTLDETLARDLEAKRPLQRRADHGGACEAGLAGRDNVRTGAISAGALSLKNIRITARSSNQTERTIIQIRTI